jgi:hypothetical protein
MSATSFIMIIMFVFVYPSNSPLWIVWLTLVVALGMGSGIGYAAAYWSRIGILLLGTWIGGLFGAILYDAVFYVFSKDNELLGLWITIAICSTIIAVASIAFFD